MKTITLYTKLKEYGFGKVNGWILNKLLDNVADLLSPGSLFVAILDVSLDGSYDKRLWKIYEQN